ncbi:MAG TPA: 16S rRNA (uracil(1498)-N(3))-methyltransferase [Streptosporangiaceae bacterium]
MPPLFFADLGSVATGDVIVLSGSEGRHASVVRRLRPGERVDVGDGAGLIAECVVTGAAPVSARGRGDRDGGLELAVKAWRRVPRPEPAITVVQAIPKGDRGELAVEEMTEVGVDRIVPWAAERSVPVWQPDAKGLAKWRATAREAAKQSRRAWIPEVTAVASLASSELLVSVSAAALAIVLDPAAAQPLAAVDVPRSGDLIVVVGPEGGITEEESAEFLAAGAAACRLGPTVLRASTAGAVTAAILLSRTARWS